MSITISHEQPRVTQTQWQSCSVGFAGTRIIKCILHITISTDSVLARSYIYIYIWFSIVLILINDLTGVIYLTHRGQVTHIFVSKLTDIGSDNVLSPGRCQAIIWTNAELLLIWTLGTNFSEISIETHAFSFKKMHLKMSSAKWRPFCLGLNVNIFDSPKSAYPVIIACIIDIKYKLGW